MHKCIFFLVFLCSTTNFCIIGSAPYHLGNLPRIAIEVRKNQYFDRALMLKSRLISRRGSITDLTTPDPPQPPATQPNVFDPKNNPFKLKGRRKSVLESTNICYQHQQVRNEPLPRSDEAASMPKAGPSSEHVAPTKSFPIGFHIKIHRNRAFDRAVISKPKIIKRRNSVAPSKAAKITKRRVTIHSNIISSEQANGMQLNGMVVAAPANAVAAPANDLVQSIPCNGNLGGNALIVQGNSSGIQSNSMIVAAHTPLITSNEEFGRSGLHDRSVSSDIQSNGKAAAEPTYFKLEHLFLESYSLTSSNGFIDIVRRATSATSTRSYSYQ